MLLDPDLVDQDSGLPPDNDQGVRSGGQGEEAERAVILTGTGTSVEAGRLPPEVRQSAGRAASVARMLRLARVILRKKMP
jgi:hypothetical protein